MRILIVTPSVPYPPNWGFGIRVFQIVRELSRRHVVSVLCYAAPGEEDKIAALEAVCHSVHVARAPLSTVGSKRVAQAKSLFRRSSFQLAGVQSIGMQSLADDLFRREKFDLVQFESSQMSWLDVPTEVPTIVDEHNIEYELLYRMFRTERSPLRKLHNWNEFRKFRTEEQASWRRSQGCVVTSERERDILLEHEPGKPTHVAPNGVDVDFFTDPLERIDAQNILFTGLLNYRPNIDAVVFFTKKVLPLVLDQRPHAVFSIVGLAAPNEVMRLSGPNVEFVGEVPDVRPYLARAGVFVVPLRMGSGTRLKVLEGLAMRKGIVSTSLGCEGIEVEDDHHLLVADDAEDFAAAVIRLLDDQDLAKRLGAAGRSLVEDRYSWVSIVSELELFHRSIVEACEGRGGLEDAPVR